MDDTAPAENSLNYHHDICESYGMSSLIRVRVLKIYIRILSSESFGH